MQIKEIILYEDNHLFIVNKPSGILAQGDSSDRHSLNEIIKDYIKKRDAKPGNVFLGIVHRLDRLVSGVMIYAKTSKSASRLSSQIRDRSTDKYYICITKENAQKDTQKKWINVKEMLVRKGNRTFKARSMDKDAKEGSLYYATVAHNRQYSLHIIKLITGRKHQIRSTFSIMGIPIADDVLYGGNANSKDSILLHSFCIKCKHPTTCEDMIITTAIPERFIRFTDFGISPENLNNLIQKIIDDFTK